jgi:hypothetical protein
MGATRASFASAHGLSLGGCPAGTCFGPKVASSAGDPYQFELVEFADGRVTGYTEAFAGGTSLAEAEQEALTEFPTDTSAGNTGVIQDDSNGYSCRWLDLVSNVLGKVFGSGPSARKGSSASAKFLKSIGYHPDQLSIEFATADSSGNWTYDPNDINQAIISVGWYAPGNDC